MRFAIVGAGFSGSVLAHELAQAGHHIEVFESRPHVAGNCHTERDPETGVLIHRYGPHVFHTAQERVWTYVNRFADFRPYISRVKTTVKGQVYSLPINLHTINQFFGTRMSPDEARAFIASKSVAGETPSRTFEEQGLAWVGRELYDAFFDGYTRKQWGCDPSELPASILKRLPLRFTYDDNYFAHPYQGIPAEGYTPIVEKLLDHPRIRVRLNTPFPAGGRADADHVFHTGPIDAWFGHDEGRLGYRTLDFVRNVAQGDAQGCAIMNYGDADVPYTRITEHKHFAPWESHEKTVTFTEYSRACGPEDTPYYPIRLVEEKALLAAYVRRAEALRGVSFLGRLGTYRYLDMDTTIGEALDAAAVVIDSLRRSEPIPVFFHSPL